MRKLNILLACAKSFMYMMSNSGPMIEPFVIDNMFDLILLISTYCLRYSILLLNKLRRVQCSPYYFNLSIKIV